MPEKKLIEVTVEKRLRVCKEIEATEEDIPIFLKFLHLMLFMKMNNCVQFSIVLWQIYMISIKIIVKIRQC